MFGANEAAAIGRVEVAAHNAAVAMPKSPRQTEIVLSADAKSWALVRLTAILAIKLAQTLQLSVEQLFWIEH